MTFAKKLLEPQRNDWEIPDIALVSVNGQQKKVALKDCSNLRFKINMVSLFEMGKINQKASELFEADMRGYDLSISFQNKPIIGTAIRFEPPVWI